MTLMTSFGMGTMVIVLKHVGMTALLKQMLVKTSDTWSAHSLSNLPGMLSDPAKHLLLAIKYQNIKFLF